MAGKFLLVFFTALLCYDSHAQTLYPIVETDLGYIQGLRASDGDYFMFMGIPFATVNSSNPFGAAIPQTPFETVFFAADDSAICPQVEEFNQVIAGTLDCLHLNIYVPKDVNPNNRLPVMVYLYGGGFVQGFAGRFIYGPKFIVRHDVILVTLNYRIGPYGFMCLDIPEVSGNQGLKDQLLGLRWVKNNIHAFGGDAEKITLFGESAGGVSVDFHLSAPHDVLVDKAILQSGTLFLPLASEPQRDAPQRLAAVLGYSTNDVYDAIRFLSTVSTNLVILAANLGQLQFTPCVEKEFENVENFVTENWIQNTKAPKVKDMPLLIGVTDDEALVFYHNLPAAIYEHLNVFNDTFDSMFDSNDPSFEGMEQIARRFYIGDEKMSESNKFSLADFQSDLFFNYPTYRSISRFLDNEAGNIFYYVFSHTGDRNFVKRRINATEGGAYHADELTYLFDFALFSETPTAEDQLVIDRMTTMWTNFAKYGNPTPEVTALLPVEWKPVTNGSAQFALDIGSDLNLTTRPFNTRMAFWDIFYLLNGHLERLLSLGSSW